MPPSMRGGLANSSACSGSRSGSVNDSTISPAGQETVVVRRDLDVVQLGQRGELAPHGETAHARAVELQYLDRLLLEQRAAALRGQLAFPGR